MPLIIPSNTITGGYEVDNSLRFDDGSSDYLSRTPSSAGNKKTLTISMWVKLSAITTNRHLICEEGGGTDKIDEIKISNADVIRIENYNDSGSDYGLVTNQVFRDVSAWYHIVVSFDSTQATAADRIKLYVNGSQVTSFSSSSYPSLNYDFYWNSNTDTIGIGADTRSPTNYFDGYMSEVVLIDGTALDPTSFGEFDEDSGIWKPIDVSGLTFGTNGFYLPFENSAALGQDDSGNGNNFTVNNLTSIDQTTDTPTNNWCTLNPLSTNSNITLSEGNLKAASSFTSDNIPSYGTIGVTTGKWYWEVKLSAATFNTGAGLAGVLGGTNIDFSTGYRAGLAGIQIATTTNGTIQNDNVNTSNYFGGAISNGDILGVALDATNKQLKFNLNGGSFGSDLNFNASYTLFIPATDVRASSGTPAVEFNFGNPSFTISSGNSDGNNFGNFEYAVPSGYYALCTKNLAEYG